MHIQVSLIVDIDASADLTTIEHQIQEAGHQTMRQALQQAVRNFEQQHRNCPYCGSGQVRLEGTVARTVQALFGAVRLPRQRLRCQHCFRRFCPAKGLLLPMHQGRVSPALAEAACLAGSSWPYRQAAQTLARLSGAQISAEEIRLLTNRCGRELAHTQEQAAAAAVSAAAPPAEQPREATAPEERTIIGLDGGWVPSRQKRGGMEGKVAVIVRGKEVLREPSQPSEGMTWVQLEKYLRRHRHPSVKRSRYRSHHYAATFAPAAVLGRAAAAAVEQIGSAQSEQVVIADGAQWIKTQTQRHFPGATCILDWPHLQRTIAKAVRAVGLQREADQEWVKRQWRKLGDWLWKGEVEPVKAVLLQWQEELKGPPPLKALTAASTYLDSQRDWIGNYKQWRRQGYPVGSGLIERAVAVVINRRMKRQGMSWLRRNATSVVALRVAVLNEEWPLPAATHSVA
jgi:transposase-like protein